MSEEKDELDEEIYEEEPTRGHSDFEVREKRKSLILTAVTVVVIAVLLVAAYRIISYKTQRDEEARAQEETTVAVSEHLEKAHEFEEAGEYGKAVSAYLLYLESGTETIKLYYDLGQDYLKLNMFEEAEECEAKILELFETDPSQSLTEEEYSAVAALYLAVADELFEENYYECYLYLTEECPLTGLYETYSHKAEIDAILTPVSSTLLADGWQEDGTLLYGTYPMEEITGEYLLPYLTEAEYGEDGTMTYEGTAFYREEIDGEYHYFTLGNLAWKVVKEYDDAYLLQTVMIVDCEPFHETLCEIAWDDCSLRSYMNETFTALAFTETEAAGLSACTNVGVGNPTYNLQKDGGTVTDTCFILGLEQVYERYNKDFHTYVAEHAADYVAQTTGYARAKGAFTDGDGYGKWWIRTMGVDSSRKMTVSQNGTFSTDGFDVDYAGIGIRAAILLSKDAIQ